MQIQWFGKSWGAPICTDSTHVATPVGQMCLLCTKAIEPRDRGFVMDYEQKFGCREVERRPAHRDCFMRSIGAPPSYCPECHVPLMGGATRHKKDCPFRKIIENVEDDGREIRDEDIRI